MELSDVSHLLLVLITFFKIQERQYCDLIREVKSYEEELGKSAYRTGMKSLCNDLACFALLACSLYRTTGRRIEAGAENKSVQPLESNWVQTEHKTCHAPLTDLT